jgi:hypothetical protein
MSNISFNSILDGVSLKLRSAYPTAQIWSGNVKQNLKDRDFNVVMPLATHTGQLGTRAERRPYILIR